MDATSHASLQPVLLVEDSPEDYEATVRGFTRARLANPIHRCEDGDEALDYLFRRGKYDDPATSPRPGVILLDLNMPGLDGREVLTEIKAHEHLRDIPVIVLTTSTDDRDINECYKAGANSYVKKPVGLANYLDAIQRLRDYWFSITILPKPREQ